MSLPFQRFKRQHFVYLKSKESSEACFSIFQSEFSLEARDGSQSFKGGIFRGSK
jgi:hypothetical protein